MTVTSKGTNDKCEVVIWLKSEADKDPIISMEYKLSGESFQYVKSDYFPENPPADFPSKAHAKGTRMHHY